MDLAFVRTVLAEDPDLALLFLQDLASRLASDPAGRTDQEAAWIEESLALLAGTLDPAADPRPSLPVRLAVLDFFADRGEAGPDDAYPRLAVELLRRLQAEPPSAGASADLVRGIAVVAGFRRADPETLDLLLDLLEAPLVVGDPDPAAIEPAARSEVNLADLPVRAAAAATFAWILPPQGFDAERLRFAEIVHWTLPLLALEWASPDTLPFRLVPPPAEGPEGLARIADALAACALGPLPPEPIDPQASRRPDLDFQRTLESRCRADAAQALADGIDCVTVERNVDTYCYCVDLRRRSAGPVAGRPSAWGCLERYPDLRERDPVGPTCRHAAARSLAARLYVTARERLGREAPDGVNPADFETAWPLDRVLAYLGGADQEDAAARWTALADVVGRVRVEYPVFRTPEPAQRIVRRTPPAEENGETTPATPSPWYRNPEWTERTARSLESLAAAMREFGGDAGEQTLSQSLRVSTPDDAPGPIVGDAGGLALLVRFGRLDAIAALPARIGTGEQTADEPAEPPETIAIEGRDTGIADLFFETEIKADETLELPAADETLEPDLPGWVAGLAVDAEALQLLETDVNRRVQRDAAATRAAAMMDQRRQESETGREEDLRREGYGQDSGRTLHIGGELAEDSIRTSLRRQESRVRRCFEAAILANPDGPGRVTVRFVVSPDGRVSTAEIDGRDAPNETLGRCILDAVRDARFPPAAGVTEVTWPFAAP
jgi:TonB family protein